MGQVTTQGNITIIDTNDIESIVVEYARNQSTSSPPSDGWSTTRPAWAQGYYIWQRTRIHKTGTNASTDTYGAAVCLTGSTGQTGAAGRSLTNMVTQYTTAASSATITQSNMGQYTWTNNVPTYSSSTPAYWVRVTNTYSNPSSTEYIIYKDNGITDAMYTAVVSNSIAQHAQEDADGALGQASVSIKEIYRVWYRTNSATAPSKPSAHVTQTSNDVTNTWTKTKPIDNSNNRYYFYCDETITNGGISSWTEPVLDTSNLSTYEIGALEAKVKNFWWDSNGAHTASGISGAEVTSGTVSTYGYNSLMGVTGFSIGYNAAKVIDLKTTPSPSSLDMYQPPSISGTTVTQGAKTVSLSGNALTFYNPSTGNAQLIIGANGILQSGNFVYTSGTYSDSGTKIDLTNGSIYTPGFRTDGSNTYIRGEINALSGKIGNNNNNYWTIGNNYNYDQTASAALISHGTAFIQLDTSNTWRLSTDRIHTAWNGTDSSAALMFPKDGDTYWDWGIHSPHKTNNVWKDKFLYARKYINTSDDDFTNRDNLSNDLDDDMGYWTYQFYVDKNGSIYARNFYLLNADGTPGSNIGGQDAVYLLKSGGTITGNLEVNGALTKSGKTVTYLTGAPTNNQVLVADGTTGGIKTSGYTIATSVPSGALFTDKNVQTSQANTTKIYLVGTSTTGTTTGTLNYDSGVYVSTTAGALYATTFNGYTLAAASAKGVDTSLTASSTSTNLPTSKAVADLIKQYLPLTGGQVTGPVSFGDSISIDEATVGDLVVNGAGRFTNGLYGDLTGNAATATKVNNNLIIKLNSGTTEGTNMFTYNGSGAKTINVTKSSIGLGNVDNTADANKNVLTATKFSSSRTIALTGDVTGSASGDGSSGWSINTTVGDDSHYHTMAYSHKPIQSKTYTSSSYYATSTGSWETSSWYFMSVKPDAWYKPWKIRFKVHSFCPSYSNVESVTYSFMTGRADSVAYSNYTEKYDNAHYYIPVYVMKKAGFDAGLGHAIGISILYGTNYSSSAYYRTFEVDFFECENCTVTILDTPVKWASWTNGSTTNYNSLSGLDAVTRGYTETGDRNDANYQNRSYYSHYKMYTASGRYKIVLTKNEEYVLPVNSTDNDLTKNKTLTSESFDPFGPIYYYNYTNRAVNTYNGNNELFQQYLVDLRYSFNCGGNANPATGTLVGNKALYLVATPQSDGSAKLYSEPLSQTLPSSENGLIYIYLGQVYSDSDPYRVELDLHHPVYWYKDGAVRPYINVAAKALTAVSATNATNATNATYATQVNKNLVIKLNGGSTEGTNLFTFNGSAAKTIDITKSSIGLGNVENTALSTWAGTSNITTVGTITTGTWSGTKIPINKGGTNATTAADARTNLGLGGAAVKAVDTSISAASTSTNLPTSQAVASFVEGKGYSTTTGTVTSVRVQASSPLQSSTSTAQSATLNTTISFTNQDANKVLAGPGSGSTAAAPTFRALVAADIPNLAWSKITSGNEDLAAIEALTGTSGLLKKTAANTWSLDTTSYVPTSRKVNGHALTGDVTVTKGDVGLGNVTNFQQITGIGQGTGGTLRVWTGDPTSTSTSDYTDVAITITAYDQSTVSKAVALDLSAAVGTTSKPVYFKADGKPYEISYTIEKSVPSNAVFTDTTYTFDGTYNASSNKAATVSTVTNAINALDGGTIGTPGTGKTISAISQTNGNISVTFSDISITKSQISDFPSSLTPSSHTHGNITNDGKITSDTAFATGDKLVLIDATDNKIIRANIAFDTSKTGYALTQAGTWAQFNNYSLPFAANGTRGGVQIGYSSSGKNYAVQLSSEKMYVNVPWTDTTYSAGTGLSLSGTTFSNSGVTGVKGNSESSYRTGQVNLTASNIGAIATNTDGNTQNLRRPIQLNGCNDNTLDQKISFLRGNRLLFLPADQIIIEKTTDGGTTWVDGGFTNDQKRHLFAETQGTFIGVPLLDGVRNVNCGIRITITAMKYNVPDGTTETQKYNYWNSSYIKSQERYCQLKEIYFWVSTANAGLSCKVERATGAASTTWNTIYDSGSNFALTGWSGNDYIRFGQGTFGGGTTQTGNYWNYRFTFFQRGNGGGTTLPDTNTTSAAGLYEIRGYGDTDWSTTNVSHQFVKNDHIYKWDFDKNVTFPAQIVATQFNGPLNGNATSATKATNDVDGNPIKTTYAKLSGATFTGAINTANATYNNIGDDVQIGDINVAGTLGIKGKNGRTGIRLVAYSGSTNTDIYNDGAGTLTITGTVSSTFSGNLTGNVTGNLTGNVTGDVTGNASTATNVAWSGITSNPISFGSTAYGTTGWKQLGGRDSGSYIRVWKPTDTATWGTVAHSAVISFGNQDTKGMLDCSYSSPLVSIAGGNNSGSTDAAPKWYFKFSATSEATYTLPTASKTLAATDGSNASGTWGISITGNAANVTGTVTTAHGGTGNTSFTANRLTYAETATKQSSTSGLSYYSGNSTASTPAAYTRLHIHGTTYGNTAANMISGTAGLFSFGDGGPQITFDSNATPGGGQAGALIYTDHDTAASGASWHFVSNQSDWNVTSKRFHARTGISVGANLPNTSYNLYVNGTTYLNGSTTVNGNTLKVANNGNTITIGSQNNSWCHIYNSANIPFIFNNTITTTNGNIGGLSYPFTNAYISGGYNMVVSNVSKAAMHYDSTLEAIVFSFS